MPKQPASPRFKAGYLAEALAYIAQKQRRNHGMPVNISISIATRDLRMSNTTWLRMVRMLTAARWIMYEPKPGRPLGGGKNPGSVFRVVWDPPDSLQLFTHVTPSSENPTGLSQNGQKPYSNGHSPNGETLPPSEKTFHSSRIQNPTNRVGNRPYGREWAGAGAPGLDSGAGSAGEHEPSNSSPLPLSGTPPPVEVAAQVAALFQPRRDAT